MSYLNLAERLPKTIFFGASQRVEMKHRAETEEH